VEDLGVTDRGGGNNAAKVSSWLFGCLFVWLRLGCWRWSITVKCIL